MSRTDALARLLARLDGEPGAPAADVAAAEAARPMPGDLRRLYSANRDPALPGMQLFALGDYEEVNRQLPPGLVGFGDDRSDRWFAIREDGAVIWLPRADLRPAAGRVMAPDLAGFLERVLAGERPWTDPEAGTEARGRIEDLLADPPPWIETRPARPPGEVGAARRALGLRRELVEILLLTDGLLVPKTGAALFGLADIAPEPGVPSPWPGPAAAWVGRAPGGARALLLGAEAGGWPAGTLVAVPDGAPWEDGEPLGPLPVAVLGWIEEGRP